MKKKNYHTTCYRADISFTRLLHIFGVWPHVSYLALPTQSIQGPHPKLLFDTQRVLSV
jgi:hypothetical protein